MAGSKIDSGQSMCKEKLFCPPRSLFAVVVCGRCLRSLFAVVVCSTQHGERERERERERENVCYETNREGWGGGGYYVTRPNYG